MEIPRVNITVVLTTSLGHLKFESNGRGYSSATIDFGRRINSYYIARKICSSGSHQYSSSHSRVLQWLKRDLKKFNIDILTFTWKCSMRVNFFASLISRHPCGYIVVNEIPMDDLHWVCYVIKRIKAQTRQLHLTFVFTDSIPLDNTSLLDMTGKEKVFMKFSIRIQNNEILLVSL